MPSVAENEKDRYALFLFKHYLSTVHLIPIDESSPYGDLKSLNGLHL